MKKLFLIFLLLNCVLLSAQNTEPVKYSEVVKVDSTLSAKTLYSNAKIWFVNSFKNSKEVIVLDDSENKMILGKANMKFNSNIFVGSGAREGWISFDISIACKDGRYKYDFTNFIHKGNSVNIGLITTDEILPALPGPTNHKIKVSKEVREVINSKILPLIDQLKKTMNKNVSTKEDW
ncbi:MULTISPECIES: DUF4468 domain-containing protein [unclassified Chryseobacterium]|uniref:DUF4468 domain-containing protein n=1 Tax=unclassified Chryseobacterium TaxID=2593645 RepID=UPI003017B319